MDDLINRSVLKKHCLRRLNDLREHYGDYDHYTDGYEECLDAILDAPVVNPLPCKIGDTVWAVRYYYGKPTIKQCVVSEMMYLEDMRLGIAVRADRKYSVRGFWGVTIFATHEECEAALGGKDNG